MSPAAALLVAMDQIRPKDHILDVGCGTGNEPLLLAEWGCRHVVGVDIDTRAIGIARGRATRRKLGKRVTFHAMDVRDMPARFPRKRFDIVLHTLVANNLVDTEVPEHFAALARMMKPNGLIVVHERVHHSDANTPPDRVPPLKAFTKHFDVSPGVATQLPESPARRLDPGYAEVFLWLGRPRS